MNIKLVEHIYFVGIGGIGMSGLDKSFQGDVHFSKEHTRKAKHYLLDSNLTYI